MIRFQLKKLVNYFLTGQNLNFFLFLAPNFHFKFGLSESYKTLTGSQIGAEEPGVAGAAAAEGAASATARAEAGAVLAGGGRGTATRGAALSPFLSAGRSVRLLEAGGDGAGGDGGEWGGEAGGRGGGAQEARGPCIRLFSNLGFF